MHIVNSDSADEDMSYEAADTKCWYRDWKTV